MREILYRAWYKGTMFPNKMYEVRNLYFFDGGVYAVLVDEKLELGNMQVGIECELMQCIGLEDVAGKKIWEGDMLFWNGWQGVVYWDQGFAAWRAQNIGSLGGIPNLEIIGNRYEHPELVEVKA